ncbi:helix-turn-helix transcriptional regulator [Candidatus Kapabacteria bacterium]|nr:helix-turn-helix transcriptional regulator [Candidatus Kapabacteria bacterium]
MPKEVNSKFVIMICDYAESRGISREWSLQGISYSEKEMKENIERIDYQTFSEFAIRIITKIGDDNFGFKLGEWLNLFAAGLISQILVSSNNIMTALNFLVEFSTLELGPYKVKLKNRNSHISLIYKPIESWEQQYPVVCKQVSEMAVVFTLKFFKHLHRETQIVERIGLMGSKEHSTTKDYLQFNIPIEFNQNRYWFDIPLEYVSFPIVSSDKNLINLLTSYASQKVAEYSSGNTYYSLVKATIFRLLKPKFPTLNDVASNLGYSTRTLQRRLFEEGWNYKQIIDELKFDLAKKYLKIESLSVKEVAWNLEYSDSSTFVRAFKKHSGTTPLSWRKSFYLDK